MIDLPVLSTDMGTITLVLRVHLPHNSRVATFAIYNLVYRIIDILVIDVISTRFLLMSYISLSFRVLSSVKEIYEHIDWEHLPVNSTIQGSKVWKKKLFYDLEESYY